MALIIEDGTIVANANSFATLIEARAYATARGLTLPTDDTEAEQLLVKAFDYLNTLEERFKGYRKEDGQETCFPREDITYYGKDIDGTIPTAIKNAQAQLAVDANDNDLLAGGNGREVIEKKTGDLVTKWNPTGNTTPQYTPTAALRILDPLFKPGSGASINLLSYK